MPLPRSPQPSIAASTHAAVVAAARQSLRLGDGAPRSCRSACSLVAAWWRRPPAGRRGRSACALVGRGLGMATAAAGAALAAACRGAEVAAARPRAAGRASALVVLVQPLGLPLRAWELYVPVVRRAARRHALAHLVSAGDGDDDRPPRAARARGSRRVVDPDMITIDDGATVHALFQAHTFEDRVLKIDRVRIGPQRHRGPRGRAPLRHVGRRGRGRRRSQRDDEGRDAGRRTPPTRVCRSPSPRPAEPGAAYALTPPGNLRRRPPVCDICLRHIWHRLMTAS